MYFLLSSKGNPDQQVLREPVSFPSQSLPALAKGWRRGSREAKIRLFYAVLRAANGDRPLKYSSGKPPAFWPPELAFAIPSRARALDPKGHSEHLSSPYTIPHITVLEGRSGGSLSHLLEYGISSVYQFFGEDCAKVAFKYKKTGSSSARPSAAPQLPAKNCCQTAPCSALPI